MWLNASSLKEGGSYEPPLYNLAANYAYNTGKVFIADPAGLSDTALRRQSENMLSSALKSIALIHLPLHGVK